jgi:serine/threonine protein kinase
MRFKEEKLLERLDFQFIGGIDNYFIPDKDDDAYEEEDEEEEESEDENENENKSNSIKKDIKEKKNNKNRKRGKRKNSFVGTIEYMSPEVIAEKPTEYGTDIWAFGIMLYQMYYNRTPFKKESAYLTFRSIEKSNFEFPHDSSIPKSAKDLIKQILVVDPKKRLGGGSQNSHYDINSLKKHPFFEGIKWNELQNESPPHMKDYKYFEQKQNNEVSKQRYSICYSANDNRINNNAKIIKKGMLRKKTTWFNYSKRYTILDSTPRLLTKNPNIPEKIKEIPLTKKCKIKLVDNNCFDLKTPIKTYRFKGTNNDGNDWAGDILDAINTYGKNE